MKQRIIFHFLTKNDRWLWIIYVLQAIGAPVLGAGLYYLLCPVVDYFKGNRAAIAYVDTYVQDWDSITVKFSDNLWDGFDVAEFHTRSKAINWGEKKKPLIDVTCYTYYIPHYKRYMELIWVEGIDAVKGLNNRYYDAARVQQNLMRGNMVISAYVNRVQWRDKSYGSKAKPVPVFLHRIISGDDIERRNAETWKQDRLHPDGQFLQHYLPPAAVKRMRTTPDSINKKYAGYYLRYMLPEDEFDRLYEK